MNNASLYITTVLIWGSTWYAMTFQTQSVVDTLLSVGYRFAFAAILLWLYCRWRGLSLKLSINSHIFLFAQGLCLFGLNYWLIYSSGYYLNTGVVAVIFSSIVIMNVINAAIFLKNNISIKVILGGLIGLFGISVLFTSELQALEFNSNAFLGLILALTGTYLASLGNILSARNQNHNIPVLQGNLYGMAYGAVGNILIAFILGKPLLIDTSLSFILSFLYLTIAGSIIAFGAYLTLLGRIGAAKAAYATLLFPIVALMISTVLENYQWHGLGIIGISLILLGNLLVLIPKR